MADWTRAQNPGAVEEILDRENKRMADSLASKVTRLKSLALDIDRDAEDQNQYLDGMDSDFTSMTGLLTGSMKRFSTMARSGRDNRKLLCASQAPRPPNVLEVWPHSPQMKDKVRTTSRSVLLPFMATVSGAALVDSRFLCLSWWHLAQGLADLSIRTW
uniref:BET1-like protein n=1 Tax=Marmota marmota marmota TaxID=9994 RepID=A0A8C5Z1J1_MARMA